MLGSSTSTSTRNLPRSLGIAAGITCFVLICFLEIQAVFRSTNSTAAIGLVFAPIAGAIMSVPAFGAGWCLGYGLTWRSSQSANRKWLAIFLGLIPLIFGIWIFRITWNGLAASQQVRRVSAMNAAQLEAVLNQPKWASNKFVLGAIAQNPNATAANLHQIVMADRPELYKRMGSYFDVMGNNTKGLAVMRLIALHPRVSSEDLEKLATSTDEYLLGDLAAKPTLSEDTLRRLAAHGGYLIEWGLAANPKTPSSILSRLGKSADQYTKTNVAANPSTPAEILDLLSNDPFSPIRIGVAQNQSTPLGVVARLVDDEQPSVRAVARGRNPRQR